MASRKAPRASWALRPVPDRGGTTADRLYPPELRADEEELIGRKPRVGIGLSGGGIRSATLSLGFFQGLAERKLLRHVDILSTVSGGGYFGAFFGHLVRRTVSTAEEGVRSSPQVDAIRARSVADDVLADPNSPAVGFLRDNGRYLAPEGAGDLLAAAAVILRNWVSVLVVLTLPILAGFAVALFAQTRVPLMVAQRWWPMWWVSPFFLLAAAAVPLFVVPPGWAYWLVPDQGRAGGMGATVAK